MKTTILASMFLVIGAGTVNAAAQTEVLGSNTLEQLTAAILADSACGGGSGGLTFFGAGSDAVEASMTGNNFPQVVAPMSRFLRGTPCSECFNEEAGACFALPPGSGITSDASKAEGMVFALDGLSIVANAAQSGSQACNGDPTPSCVPDLSHGLATSTTVAGYTFGDVPSIGAGSAWADVLRIIYAGMTKNSGSNIALRDCNSTVRQALANDWHALFQNISDPPSVTPNCNQAVTGDCPVQATQLRHAFRPNDQSGTTGVFLAVLGLPAANLTGGVTGNPDRFSSPGPTGLSTFCNSAQQVDNLGPGNCAREATGVCSEPGSANAGPKYGESCMVGAATGTCARAGLTCYCQRALPTAGVFPGVAPPSTEIGALSGANPSSQSFLGPHFVDEQDFDPIRRTCAGLGLAEGSEDVCSARGDLGLVLPIWDPPQTADFYPATNCQNGKFIDMPWIRYRANGVNAFAHCPDGSPTAIGTCPVPATSTGDPRCWSARRNGSTGGTLLPFYPNRFDGRVFNLYTFEDSATGFRIARTPRLTGVLLLNPGHVPPVINNTPLVAGFHRLHAIHGLASGVHCTAVSAADAIGCLVQASPCSIGYATRESTKIVVNFGAGADALKVAGLDPNTQCIRNLIANATFPPVGATYPLSRRVYFNTLWGFNNIPQTPIGSANENQFQFAACIANRAVIDPKLIANNFITLSTLASDRPTYCQDFNEFTSCQQGTANINQCKARVGNGHPFPSCEEGDPAATCGN